jgi:hypothetical protein
MLHFTFCCLELFDAPNPSHYCVGRKRKRTNKKPFVGDQVFAILQGIGCCCPITGIGILAALFLWVAKDNWPTELKKVDKWFSTQSYVSQFPGIALAALWLVTTLIAFWFIKAIWTGRAWIFWLLLFTNGFSTLGSIYIIAQSDKNSNFQVYGGSFGSVLMIIYCIMRLSGKAGPKPS